MAAAGAVEEQRASTRRGEARRGVAVGVEQGGRVVRAGVVVGVGGGVAQLC